MGVLHDLRKHNLRKAQIKFDRVNRHKLKKEFQINFKRSQHKNHFKTSLKIVRGQKSFYGKSRGLIHKTVSLKYRVNGDIPSFTKTLDSFQPKTFKGKIFKESAQAVNFIVHDAAQTAVDVGLASEDISLKTATIAVKETANKLKQKYTREAVDDYHKGLNGFFEKSGVQGFLYSPDATASVTQLLKAMFFQQVLKVMKKNTMNF